MNIEVLDRVQDLTDELARCKERERLIKLMLDSGSMDEGSLRLILDHPKISQEEEIEGIKEAVLEGLRSDQPVPVLPEPTEPVEEKKPKNPLCKVYIPDKPNGRPKRVDREQVIAMKAGGMKPKEIAEKLGCAVGTVYAIVKEDAE